MTKHDLNGDSGEYEMLTEAVRLSADIEGICCEIGLRLGRGMAEIIEAVSLFCPKKLCLSIDPYGSIEYVGREHMGPCRLDYTEQMRNICLGMMYPFANEKSVRFKFIELTDTDFFEVNKGGIIIYDLERKIENAYSMIHFDGPHYIAGIKSEIDFFAPRTNSGGTWVFDDTTPDFYDHTVIHSYLLENGFELVNQGVKKALYKKL